MSHITPPHPPHPHPNPYCLLFFWSRASNRSLKINIYFKHVFIYIIYVPDLFIFTEGTGHFPNQLSSSLLFLPPLDSFIFTAIVVIFHLYLCFRSCPKSILLPSFLYLTPMAFCSSPVIQVSVERQLPVYIYLFTYSSIHSFISCCIERLSALRVWEKFTPSLT